MGRGQGGGGGKGKIAGGGAATSTITQSGAVDTTGLADPGIANDSLTAGLIGQTLTKAEEKAIYDYTRWEYEQVNATLGGFESGGRIPTMADWSENARQMHANLPTALSKLPEYNGTTYRMVQVRNIDTFIKDYVPGQGIEIGNYMSTAKRKNVFGIDDAMRSGGSGTVVYTVRGKRGRDIESRSAYGSDEAEVLFTHGSKFIVRSVKRLRGGGYHITLEQ